MERRNGNIKKNRAGCQWLTPVILATHEVKIKRIKVRSQPSKIVCKTLAYQIVCKTLSLKKKKKPSQKRAGGVAQDVGPEFKPSTTKKKKKSKKTPKTVTE
jgi:hypothetical protein